LAPLPPLLRSLTRSCAGLKGVAAMGAAGGADACASTPEAGIPSTPTIGGL
jgi:hypothetical protein